MPLDQITNIFSFFQIKILAKLLILVIGFFLIVFTIIVYRKISLMSQTLDSSVSPKIRKFALAQIIVLTVLFFLALIFA